VIVLDREVGEPVNLEIEGIPAFQCLPGTARRTLGVKVLKRFEASGRGRLGQLVPGHEADNAEQQ
jgi:flagellar motor switch protein FliM